MSRRVDLRRLTATAVLAGCAAAAVLVDPDLRGPLAAVADLYAAGHLTEARALFDAHAHRVRARGIDPDLLRPPGWSDVFDMGCKPSAAAAAATPPDLHTLDPMLDRLGRDDAARHLFRALYLARSGWCADASAQADALVRSRGTVSTRSLRAALRRSGP